MLLPCWNRHDTPRPSFLQSFKCLVYSRIIWRALFLQKQPGISASCSQVKRLLHRTPSIPASPEFLENTDRSSLSLEGYTEWSLLSDNNCGLGRSKKNGMRRVYIGVSQPATCRLSADFGNWMGFNLLPASSGNYLSILALGWSYILSTRLIELRQQTADDGVFYTGNWSPLGALDDSPSCFSLDFDGSDFAEAQWWAALLAPGRGWQAVLKRDCKSYYPPWECHLGDTNLFRLNYKAPISFSRNASPPSSNEAQRSLYNLARRYNCFDQLLTAFTAALTFPRHARTGYYITLPLPIQSSGNLLQDLEPIYKGQLPSPDDIPSFLCLSSTTNFVISCLGSCIWDENVPSNLVSEWLNPLLEETIPSLVPEGKVNTILDSLARRRPQIASLFLGAAITGLLSHVVRICESHTLPVSLEAYAWATSPQSFMDPENHRRVPVYFQNGRSMIPREDELRLLYLTNIESRTYELPPLCAYPPSGLVSLDQCSLDVQLHVHCGHRLSYLSWNWITKAGQAMRDDGVACSGSINPGPQHIKPRFWLSAYLASFIRTIHYGILCLPSIIYAGLRDSVRRNMSKRADTNEHLSLQATQNLFCWTLFAEGTKEEDRETWKHEWLKDLLEVANIASSSYSSSSSGRKSSSEKNDWVLRWREDINPVLDSI